jgi:hypothetical protein
MNALASAKLVAATVAAGFVLAVIGLWREYPGFGPDCAPHTACFLPPFEYVLKIVAALLTLAWTSSVAIRSFPSHKVLASTAGCALGGAIGFAMLSMAVAPVDGRNNFPIGGVAMLGLVTGLFGALVSWRATRWWPNNALERTRER